MHSQFTLDAQRRIQSLRREFSEDASVVYALRAFYAGSAEVDRGEFGTFCMTLLDRYGSITSLQHLPYVPVAQRVIHEQAVTQELMVTQNEMSGYVVTESNAAGEFVKAGERSDYYPVYFIEPLDMRRELLGYDWGSVPAARAAIMRAAKTGQVVTSGRVTLQHRPEGAAGVLVVGPIYRNGTSVETEADRMANFEGVVVGAYSAFDVLRDALALLPAAGVDMQIMDETDRSNPERLYVYASSMRIKPFVPMENPSAEVGLGMNHVDSVEMMGRRWVVYCTPSDLYEKSRRTWIPVGTLISGLLVTTILIIHLISSTERTARIEKMVGERTSELQTANEEMERQIADRRIAQQSLRDSEALYHSLVEYVPMNIFRKDREGRFTFCNKRFCEAVGKTEEELHGKTDMDLFPVELAEKYQLDDQEVLDTGEIFSDVEQYQDAQGRTRHNEVLKTAIRDSDHQIVGTQGIFWDVTERHQAEEQLQKTAAELALANQQLAHINDRLEKEVEEHERTEAALRDSEQRLQAILDNTSALIYLKTLDGRYELVNREFSRVLGLPFREIIGKTAGDLFSEEEAGQIQANDAEVIRTGELMECEEVTFHEETPSTYISIKFPLRQPDGEMYAIAGISTDITDRKQSEQEIKNFAEALKKSNEELEQFAYVASHDLQEPLRMVASYVQLLQRRYSEKLDEQANEFIHFAVDGAKRMQTLIQDLLEYSRVSTRGGAFVEVDCEKVLQDTMRNLTKAVEGSGADVSVGTMPRKLVGDATQLAQLFQNLIGNAIKFFDPDRSPKISVTSERVDGCWRFSVADNGIGIDPKYADRIFVIFKRLNSREHYEGTGIGLAVCKRIVDRHGGRIWFDSEPGKGTTFHFEIPDKELIHDESDEPSRSPGNAD